MTVPYRDRDYMPDQQRLHDLLFGRKIVSVKEIDTFSGELTLDDGTVLVVGGNEGGCICGAGDYPLATLGTVDNAITNVVVEERPDGEDFSCEECGSYYCDHEKPERGFYRIFVIAEDHNQHLVASFEGSDGNGYYGTGWWLSVRPAEGAV